MREIAASDEVDLQVVATNMHLSPEFGMTVNDITGDGFTVDARIESLVSGGTPEATVISMAKAQEGLAEAFKNLQPDLVVILGDRYEALAAASAAVVFNIPVAHLHGGETTEGAIDDKFRHAITQLADYHFAATPQYAERIISMGRKPENVFHSGAPGADTVTFEISVESPQSYQATAVDKEFYDKTGIMPFEPFIILAFHPVTLLPDKGMKELQATLRALDTFIAQGYKIMVTMPNSDPGNRDIREYILKWSNDRACNVSTVESLGSKLFHYAMDKASAMVGNSSAALIEAPSHRLGAVNVGIRQKGRAHGITVIDSPDNASDIIKSLESVLSLEMKAVLMGMHVSSLNPYYKENSASFIAEKLIDICISR